MFGWSEDEIRGRRLCEVLLPPVGRARYEETVRRLLATPPADRAHDRFELAVVRRDGRELSAEWSMARIDLHGVTHCSAFLRDITERRLAEAEIRRLNAGLERRVDERTLLAQVVINLLGNAVKFTRHRDPAVIEIGTLASPEAGGMATIFVRDNGAGFNPKYADKLFGVFQRLHNQRDFEGTGIGLANVKRIVTRHGGAVSAQGNVDKGAEFKFTLPADLR